MNARPIEWIQKNDTWISSFIFWNKAYIPYQSVMLRKQDASHVHMVYYFKIQKQFVGSMIRLPNGRTNTEEEWVFHIARKGYDLLEQWIHHDHPEGHMAPPLPKTLLRMIEEAFISEVGMQLIEEEYHPDFGFYSLSPNFNKLRKMIEGQPFSLFDFIQDNKRLK